MKILAIETSCDETAIALLEGIPSVSSVGNISSKSSDEKVKGVQFTVLGDALLSQIEIHKPYGGVFPMVAKREHARNIVPLLKACLENAAILQVANHALSTDTLNTITKLLEREPGLTELFLEMVQHLQPPAIDAIAVTAGPGLEPALWVGVNVARALAVAWNLPLVAANHMEGHILSALLSPSLDGKEFFLPTPPLPLLSLLISGGHTELVVSTEPLSYTLVGQTRDDAVGEAFDKVARMLGLSYPGGPEISKLSEKARARVQVGKNPFTFPRPMIHEPHLDFSFSGLKTSVLYAIKNRELSDTDKENVALAFEDAVADVLYAKTAQALLDTNAASLALGGGVSANTHITRTFRERIAKEFPDVSLFIPAPALTSDNAIMIGLAGYFHAEKSDFADVETLRAQGNRSLT
jgi:N6-L-threonylcarbamoyladenine synthase